MLNLLTRIVWSNYQVWKWSNCCRHFSIGTWHSCGPSTGLLQADIKLFPRRQCPTLSWHSVKQRPGLIGEHCRAGEGRSWPLCQVNKCPLPHQCVCVPCLLRWLSQSRVSFWKSDCAPEGREAQGLPAGKDASQMYKANSGKLAGALEGSWGMVAACLQPSWL